MISHDRESERHAMKNDGTEGSVLMEYVLVVVIVLLGGSLAVGDAGNTLLEMAGVSVSEENNFGLFGNYAVEWFRRLMWMVAQPFP